MREPTESWVEADLIITGAGELLTCPRGDSGPGVRSDLGKVSDGAIAARSGRVAWVGKTAQLREEVRPLPGAEVVEAQGRVVMPGLVECHAHLAFVGDRPDEFQLRVSGATYQEVAAAGGGIMSTVHETRSAKDQVLRESAHRRLDLFLTYGVTTVEAKSGYGLSLEQELRLLEVYRDLDAVHPVDVVPTLLGMHVVPVEFSDRVDDYVKMVAKKMVPAAAKRKLARFCDAFCEKGAFSVDQCRRVLAAGLEHGLLPKLHADQLSSTGGTEMAVELGAVSVDHLDKVSDAGIASLAAAAERARAAGAKGRAKGQPPATVAVLLPGATFFLGEGGHAPARRLLDAGVPVALSTDFNPGSSPTQNLWLMATMGCSALRMSAAEVIRAITIEAAAAVGLDHEVGSLEVGKKADILILEHTNHTQIPYRYGMNPVWRVFKAGRCVVRRDETVEEW
ncbi:MAG: imidazolonepropionase [bacterium]